MGCQQTKDKRKEPKEPKKKLKYKTNQLNSNSINEKNEKISTLKNSENISEHQDKINTGLKQEDQVQINNNYNNIENQNFNQSQNNIKNDIRDSYLKSGQNQRNLNEEYFQSNIQNNIDNVEISSNLLELSEEEYIPNCIGKLCFEPLTLFIYDSKKNTFHAQKFEQIDFERKLNQTSSCCNGDNKLFISGGIDNDGEIIDQLFIFDLNDYTVEGPIQMNPKNGHSMIYIPKYYIFFVGGNDENSFYFDINEKKVENWDNLNKKRLEPALIQMNNYLYVFDNVNKNEDINDFEITFEKTNLLSSNHKWELIVPKLSREVCETRIVPKFFGVVKDSEESIIFLGGNIMDEYDNFDDIKNYRYNTQQDLIEFSEVPFVNIQLKEKKFLAFNNKNDVYFILPDFYKKCPQVVFFIKNKNMLKVIDYNSTNIRNNDERKLNALKYDFDLKKENLGFKKYNFNMPKIPEILEKN